jgi:hypothetical protein
MTKIQKRILRLIDSSYNTDRLISQLIADSSSDIGDGLATFVFHEIADVTLGDDDYDGALGSALHAMSNAVLQLACVERRLRTEIDRRYVKSL